MTALLSLIFWTMDLAKCIEIHPYTYPNRLSRITLLINNQTACMSIGNHLDHCECSVMNSWYIYLLNSRSMVWYPAQFRLSQQISAFVILVIDQQACCLHVQWWSSCLNHHEDFSILIYLLNSWSTVVYSRLSSRIQDGPSYLGLAEYWSTTQ